MTQTLLRVCCASGRPPTISSQRDECGNRDVRIRVFVDGTRASGFVDTDANGVVIAIDGQAIDDVD